MLDRLIDRIAERVAEKLAAKTPAVEHVQTNVYYPQPEHVTWNPPPSWPVGTFIC